MGAKCCAKQPDEFEIKGLADVNASLDLNGISIAEFETRVKKYAVPAQRGRVFPEQLMEAFKDTKIFSQLNNPESLVNKVIMSPFFMDFTLSHNETTEVEKK